MEHYSASAMKIAIVSPYDLHSPGGVQTHILDLSKELIRQGHYVKVIAPGNHNRQNESNDIIYLGKTRKIEFNKTRFDVSLVYGNDKKKLLRILSEENFDVIHYHTIWTPFLPLQILLASTSANVATFHDTPPDNISGRLTKLVFRVLSYFLLKKLDAAIAVSGAPAEHLAKIPRCVIHIIPPCTDLRSFSPEVKPLIKKDDEAITILFLGRLEQRKGFNLLLEVFDRLVKEQFNVRLLMAGDGNAADHISKHVHPDAQSRIKILGRIYEYDKAACYTSCDIFCSPALYGESFGIVLVEAMASGRPVIAAANKGYSKVLKARADLCLAKAGDVEDLYLKLRNLVMNKKLREDLGQWGIAEAKKYQCSKLVNQYIDIYRTASGFKR
jgi:phosphatidylinositol alpha-mannosyltransferase